MPRVFEKRAACTLCCTGVHYRVDLFLDRGSVVLSEFTPWPMAGKVHCIAPILRNGTTDACHMGRLWRKGGQEGGDIPPTPSVLRSWWPTRPRTHATYKAECQLATSLPQRSGRRCHHPGHHALHP